MKKNVKKILIIVIVSALVIFVGYKVYNYLVEYAAQRVTQGVAKGVTKGIGGIFK